MKLTFDIINYNYNLVQNVKNQLPQIEQYENREIDWRTIGSLGLCNIANMNTTFSKIEDTDVALGDVIVTFEDLQPLLKKYSKKLYKFGKKDEEEDWQDSPDEVRQLKDIKKICKNITKKEFDSYFTSKEKYEELFPYLWRIEKSLTDYMIYEIFNYLVNSEIEVFDEIVEEYPYEYMTEKDKFDMEETSENKVTIDNSNEVLDQIMNLIENSNDIDKDYLKEELKTKLGVTL
ncbi:MAG: hypothetical protein SLAVMIC_00863 [uncultured marine phage]|uniref:Uncharacterized protein n=1 Tax=uncultured marine phage TaxID=707152 RepID=A0A8D9C9N2_9VIRU|nr:MAG: hypothetical protein SLAVMIC_00863 [uncultured marine phage]